MKKTSATQPFRAVLFDFGGVFIDSPFPAFAANSREIGVDPDRLLALTFGPFHEDTDHPWHRVERGELSMMDALAEITALYRAEAFDFNPFTLLARTMSEHTRANPLVVECVRALRASGLKTSLVTNNAFEIRERWRSMLPVEELFDDVVDSSEVGMRKPDPAIYRLALERLGGIEPEASIFLDDLPDNLSVAKRLGMRGVLVAPDPEPALEELRSLVAGT